MNLVGKIFTVLILVFSLVFASFAVSVYATHKNWKGEADEIKKKLGAETEKNVALKLEFEKEKRVYDSEKQASVVVRANLEQEAKEFKDERDQLAKQQQDLKKQLSDATTDVDKSLEELKLRRAEVEKLRTEIREAQKDSLAHFKEVQRQTDVINQLANEVARLKVLQNDLAEKNADMKQVLMILNAPTDPRAMADVPPQIEAVVTAVAGDGLVEISVGADDGIRKSHKLELYRLNGTSNTYVGRIEVQRTSPDRAVCKIIPSYMKSPVQKGDRVANKLQ